MGRKIPGKKHRGVKDPDKQRAKRLSELETKINAPPRNIEDQDIPKSLERLIKLKEAVRNNPGLVQKKKKKKGAKLIRLGAEQVKSKPHPKGRPEKVVPIFDQKPGETEQQFLHRVNRETHNFIKETEFEQRYNVQVKRNAATGEIEGLVKKPKDELSELEKLQAKHKNIKKKKKIADTEGNVKLSKSQKRKQKLLQKKQKKHQDDVDEFKTFKDKVEFGEVAHAPPELKPLTKNINKASVKAKTKGLLLSSLLENEHSENKPNAKVIDRTGKRKDLPVGERRQLEKQQADVIAAYKLLKARKFGDSSMSA